MYTYIKTSCCISYIYTSFICQLYLNKTEKTGRVIFLRVTEWIKLTLVKLISSSLQLVVVFAKGPNVFLHEIVEIKLEL